MNKGLKFGVKQSLCVDALRILHLRISKRQSQCVSGLHNNQSWRSSYCILSRKARKDEDPSFLGRDLSQGPRLERTLQSAPPPTALPRALFRGNELQQIGLTNYFKFNSTSFKEVKTNLRFEWRINELRIHPNREGATLKWQFCLHYYTTPPSHLNLPKSCQYHRVSGEALV